MKKLLFIILFITIGLTISLILVWSQQNNIFLNLEPTKEYVNNQFGYSLKYSPLWNLEESENSPVGHVKLASNDLRAEGDNVLSGAFIDIFVLPKEQNLTLKLWLNQKDIQNSDLTILSEEEITLNGYSGIKRITSTFGDVNKPSYDIFLEADDKVYEIAGNVSQEKQSEIDKILNSFEILN